MEVQAKGKVIATVSSQAINHTNTRGCAFYGSPKAVNHSDGGRISVRLPLSQPMNDDADAVWRRLADTSRGVLF